MSLPNVSFCHCSSTLFQIDFCGETYYLLQCSRLSFFSAMGIKYLDKEVLTYSVEQLLAIDLTIML